MSKPTVQGLLNLTTAIAASLGILLWSVQSGNDAMGQTGFGVLMFSAAIGCGYLVKGFSVSGIAFGVSAMLVLWTVLAVLVPALS